MVSNLFLASPVKFSKCDKEYLFLSTPKIKPLKKSLFKMLDEWFEWSGFNWDFGLLSSAKHPSVKAAAAECLIGFLYDSWVHCQKGWKLVSN